MSTVLISRLPRDEDDHNLAVGLSKFENKIREIQSLFKTLDRDRQIQAIALLQDAVCECKDIVSSVESTPVEGNKVEDAVQSDLTCDICSMTFKKMHFFARHVDGHTKNTCELCNMSFARRRALVLHMIEEHKVKKAETLYRCEQCNRQFAKKPSLIAHMVNYHAKEEGKLGCRKCGKLCTNYEELELHQAEHRRSSKFSCPKCHETFKRKQQFDLHMQGHEKNRCSECGEEFSDFKLLARHTAKIHQQILQRNQNVKETGAGAKKVEDDGTLREFPIGRPKSCKTSCDAADDVSGWNSMSAEEEATICQYCGVMFSYRQALEKHSVNCGASTTEEGDARFQCDDCGHKFKSKSALARHRQVHDVQRPFLCHCGQSYKRYKHLQNHLLLEHNTVVRQENPLLVTVCADSSDIALSDDMVVEAVLS